MSSACGARGEAQREGESLGRAEDNAGPGTKKHKPALNAIRLDAGRHIEPQSSDALEPCPGKGQEKEKALW